MEIWSEGPGLGGPGGGIDAAGELKEITKESWEVRYKEIFPIVFT